MRWVLVAAAHAVLCQPRRHPAGRAQVVSSLVGPLVGGLVMGAFGLAVMIAAGAAALSLSWMVVPLLVGVCGAGGVAAGVFATAAAGAILLPSLVQLVFVGGGLWLGASLAQQLFYGGTAGSRSDPDGTIDVEARTVDDWREEIFQERRDAEAELSEFDDLLRRREQFKRRGPPYG